MASKSKYTWQGYVYIIHDFCACVSVIDDVAYHWSWDLSSEDAHQQRRGVSVLWCGSWHTCSRTI